MKKLLVLLGILAAFSFVACNKEADPVNPPASDPIENPTDTPDVPDTPDTPDVPDTPDEPEAPTEIVLFEVKSSYQEEAHCKEIGNKTALSEYAGKTVVLTIKYLEGDRNGWGIGEVFFATDNENLYGTKTGKVDIKGTAATDNICTIEYPVDDVIAAMGDAEYISINLWNQTELVKISVK